MTTALSNMQLVSALKGAAATDVIDLAMLPRAEACLRRLVDDVFPAGAGGGGQRVHVSPGKGKAFVLSRDTYMTIIAALREDTERQYVRPGLLAASAGGIGLIEQLLEEGARFVPL